MLNKLNNWLESKRIKFIEGHLPKAIIMQKRLYEIFNETSLYLETNPKDKKIRTLRKRALKHIDSSVADIARMEKDYERMTGRPFKEE